MIALRAELIQRGNAKDASAMKSYMKDIAPFFGVRAGPQRDALKVILKSYPEYLSSSNFPNDSLVSLVDALFKEPEREMHCLASYILCEVSRAFRKGKGKMSTERAEYVFSYIKSLIVCKSWWDTVDQLVVPLGIVVLSSREIGEKEMRVWSQDENFWVRRAAIIHQRGFKELTNKELLDELCISQFGSTEFFINKAVGWALRDYAWYNPQHVFDFCETHKDAMAKLTHREACKNLHKLL